MDFMCRLLSSKSKENEVSVEGFLQLKEIDSLTKMRIHQLKSKSEQEDRLFKLNNKRQEAVLQTTILKQELVLTHNNLAEIDQKIKIASVQKQRLMDMGGDEVKIKHYISEISSLEDQGFTHITRADEIDLELTDLKTFINGLEKTIQEIQAEVVAEVEKIEGEIRNFDHRLSLLLADLPSDYKNLFLKISAKNLAHGPFTRVDQGSCYFCRFKISRIDESEIDIGRSLKTCPQCSRIFLPYGA